MCLYHDKEINSYEMEETAYASEGSSGLYCNKNNLFQNIGQLRYVK